MNLNTVYHLPIPNILTGKDVTIAVLDTGISPHPDLTNKVICFRDFTNGKKVMYDDNGHGTHVAGIICGNGSLSRNKLRGIAPNVNIVCIKVLDRYGNGSLSQVKRGLLWVLKNKEYYKIKILNISIGTIPDEDTDEDSEFMEIINEIWDSGICVFAAAGNGGPQRGSITSPGINRKIITVGCCEPFYVTDRSSYRKLLYPGRGPVLRSCVMKPEIVAFGREIISCNSKYKTGQNAYIKKSGTSMASPMAAASAALLLEIYPEISNFKIKLCFSKSCTDLGYPKEIQGWGLINPYKLVETGRKM